MLGGFATQKHIECDDPLYFVGMGADDDILHMVFNSLGSLVFKHAMIAGLYCPFNARRTPTGAVHGKGNSVFARWTAHNRSERLHVRQILLFNESQPVHALQYRCDRDKML